jgi:hypothetical protein
MNATLKIAIGSLRVVLACRDSKVFKGYGRFDSPGRLLNPVTRPRTQSPNSNQPDLPHNH